MTGSKVLFSTLAVTALAFAAPATAKIATGSNVSDMVVTDSNGVHHNLSDFAGQKVVLEWTNEGCPNVKKHYKTNNMQKTQQLATAEGAVWLSSMMYICGVVFAANVLPISPAGSSTMAVDSAP